MSKDLLKIIKELDEQLYDSRDIANLADFILYGDSEEKIDPEFLELLENTIKTDSK